MTRVSRAIDTAPFENIIQESLRAYRQDPTYAVDMAKQAVAIKKKRAVWKLRLEIRKAETEAREQCSKAPMFLCKNRGPCGTGEGCLFAKGDLSRLESERLDPEAKANSRPQPSIFPKYNTEQVVKALQELREND